MNERCTHSGVGTACCPDPKCQHRYELPPATGGISQGFCIFCNRENRFRANNRDTVFYYLKREKLYPDVVKSVLHIVTTKLLERGLSFSDEEESWIAWPTLATLVGSQPPIKTDQAIIILEKFSRESIMPPRRFRVGSFITHDDELFYAPVGIGTNSYSVLPEKDGLASLAIVNESGKLEAWVLRDVPTKDAFDYLKDHGKPKDWDPNDHA